jgi:hypothetical protein
MGLDYATGPQFSKFLCKGIVASLGERERSTPETYSFENQLLTQLLGVADIFVVEFDGIAMEAR